MDKKYFEEFGKPFPYSDVHWRLQYVDTEENQGLAIPYLDARAIADRFDEVLGQGNWRDEYTPWHKYTETVTEHNKPKEKNKCSQLCTIYVYDDERKEWVGKTDGAENTDIESVKGGLSDAFKRAAVKWNVGRYMYKMKPVWVMVKKKGKGYDIDPSEKKELEDEYNNVLAEVFGTSAVSDGGKKQQTKKPQKSNPEPKSEPKVKDDFYEVIKIKVDGNGNEAHSTLVLRKDGADKTVYMYGSDPMLKTGIKLKNVKGNIKKNAYGSFTFLSKYEIAA